jgi:hypothetical protein
MTLYHDKLAERAIDYYYNDLTDENALHEYLEDNYTDYDEEVTVHHRLKEALCADIHDLLKNGNDEDLGWEEDEVQAIRDGDYYSQLDSICSFVATKLLERIYS